MSNLLEQTVKENATETETKNCIAKQESIRTELSRRIKELRCSKHEKDIMLLSLEKAKTLLSYLKVDLADYETLWVHKESCEFIHTVITETLKEIKGE